MLLNENNYKREYLYCANDKVTITVTPDNRYNTNCKCSQQQQFGLCQATSLEQSLL